MKNKDLQADRFIAGNAFDEADGAVFTEDLTIFRENLSHSIWWRLADEYNGR